MHGVNPQRVATQVIAGWHQRKAEPTQPPTSRPEPASAQRRPESRDSFEAAQPRSAQRGNLQAASRDIYTSKTHVTWNPADVNLADDHNSRSMRHRAYAVKVAVGAQAESKALARLSPHQRQQYAAVRASLKDAGSAGDTPAQYALQQMLVKGRLPGGKTGPFNGNLLDQFARIAQGKVGPRLDGDKLLADLVQELHDPSAINQQRNNTCGATSASMHLARHRPAEYARLVADLALKGKARLADGSEWRREDAAGAARGRSQSQHLLQPVFTEIGNGWRDYNDKNDSHWGLGDWADGLAPGGVCHVLDRVYARDFSARGNLITGVGSNAISDLKSRTQRGDTPLAVIASGGPNLHYVMVTGVKREGGTDFVHFTNPWGRDEKMRSSDFHSLLRSYVVDERR